MLIVDGIRLPGHFQPEFIERARGYHQPRDDILIVSYPKAGTHWLCHILSLILTDFGTTEAPVYLEAAGDNGQTTVNISNQPRIVFSHLPIGFFETVKSKSSAEPVSEYDSESDEIIVKRRKPREIARYRRLHKVIYLCRNPADVIVSYHYHCQTLASLYGDEYACKSLEEFSESFLKDECYYGSYFKHVKDWLSSTEFDLHVVSYEQLQLDFNSTIRELLKFIGREKWLSEGNTQVKLRRLREECTINRTRRLIQKQVADIVCKAIDGDHLSQDQRHSVKRIQTENSDREKFISVFAHKGLIGEGQAKLNDEILRKLHTLTIELLADTPIAHIWKSLGILRS
ncbi:3-beta-hydroxysteroid sulfotransferase-like [Varroa jacobsoni]|uniref:3-beta-hydroxysteroid sulfotransferase-like n=1 Tax=Varroa jacobsoni TaxID=62625 RepID=UPI000BF91567|nr:3-beta-hydroxysteroid sulfotransferase-like [Varroa jacobsoni]